MSDRESPEVQRTDGIVAVREEMACVRRAFLQPPATRVLFPDFFVHRITL